MFDASATVNRVVVGVDFSVASTVAASWAAQWLVRNAEVVLVNALGTAADANQEPPAAAGVSGSRPKRRDVERQLRELSRGLPAEFVWCEIGDGTATDAMLAAAAEFRADLVIVGAPNEPAGSCDGRESTMGQLIRRSRVPVVVAAGRMERHPRRILVLANDAAPAPAAIGCAEALGAPYGADVSVLPWTASRLAEEPATAHAPGAAIVPNAWFRRPDARPRARSATSLPFRSPSESAAETGIAEWPGRPNARAATSNWPRRSDIDLIILASPVTADATLSSIERRVSEAVRRAPCPVVFVPYSEGAPRVQRRW